MSTLCRNGSLIAVLSAFSACGECHGKPTERPIWAKHASALDLSCLPHSKVIFSPDHRSSVRVLCKMDGVVDPEYTLQVRASGRQTYKVSLDEGAHELLWSRDSHAFFVDGGTSSYAGFFVTVYLVRVSGIVKINVTEDAQRDMVARYPPCKAYNSDKSVCGRIASDPDFNMSGVAWIRASSAIAVFAEVPCSSSYGGILCQIFGYEISVPDGRVLRCITGPHISELWKDYLAWKVHLPGPPKYGPADDTF